jgi:hypothetical protein
MQFPSLLTLPRIYLGQEWKLRSLNVLIWLLSMGTFPTSMWQGNCCCQAWDVKEKRRSAASFMAINEFLKAVPGLPTDVPSHLSPLAWIYCSGSETDALIDRIGGKTCENKKLFSTISQHFVDNKNNSDIVRKLYMILNI